MKIEDLPGEIFCHILRFVSHESLHSVFLVKKFVLEVIENHNFWELKCLDLGLELEGGQTSYKEKFTEIFWLWNHVVLSSSGIEDRYMGNELEFPKLAEGSYQKLQKHRVVGKEKLEVCVKEPTFQYCQDPTYQEIRSYRLDKNFSFRFRITSSKMDLVRFGLYATDMGSYRQNSCELIRMKIKQKYSGKELKFVLDKGSLRKIKFVLDGYETTKEIKVRLAPTSNDLIIHRVFARLNTPGDEFCVLSCEREVETFPEEMKKTPEYIKKRRERFRKTFQKN